MQRVKQILTLLPYVKNTDYASSSTKRSNKTYSSRALEMINGEALSAQAKSYSEYGSLNNGAFIGKGTLENVCYIGFIHKSRISIEYKLCQENQETNI